MAYETARNQFNWPRSLYWPVSEADDSQKLAEAKELGSGFGLNDLLCSRLIPAKRRCTEICLQADREPSLSWIYRGKPAPTAFYHPKPGAPSVTARGLAEDYGGASADSPKRLLERDASLIRDATCRRDATTTQTNLRA